MAKIKINKLSLLPLYRWQLKFFLPLLVIGMLLFSILIYNNFTIEQAKKLAQLQLSEQELKQELSTNYEQIKNVPAYLAKFPELEQLILRLNSQFPTSDEIASLLIQINQIAEDSNVSIISFSPQSVKLMEVANAANAQHPIMAELFSISAKAKYLNFVEFIFRMSRLARVVAVQNVYMVRIDDHTINVNLDIQIFFSSN